MKALMGLIFLICASCGIKGPPLPPLSEEAMKKQKAESVTVNSTQKPAASSGDTTKKTN
jgi:hypothetical protein